MNSKISLIFSALVVSLILFMGIGLLYTGILIDRIPKPNRTYLGIVFIIYSSYRAYRIYKSFKDIQNND